MFSLRADYLRYQREGRGESEFVGELWMLVAMKLTLLAEIPELLLLANLAGRKAASCHF